MPFDELSIVHQYVLKGWKSREKRIDLFKKMEKIVIHRGLDSIMDKRKTAPIQSGIGAAKASRYSQLKKVLAPDGRSLLWPAVDYQ